MTGRSRPDEDFTPQSPWLDLINSEQWDGFGRLTDHLRDPRWTSEFLKCWSLRPRELERTETGGQLTGLRTILRAMTESIASGRSLTRGQIRALNRHLRAPAYTQVTAERGALRCELKPVRRNWRWVRAQIAASFVRAVHVEGNRIKVCRNAQCRWAFVDGTKGNVRRWCKDRRCGNRARVRRARASKV
jgi:predicted RNA-binding Zn ribbon-like protein